MKKLIILATASALITSSAAFAQSPPDQTTSPPMQTPPPSAQTSPAPMPPSPTATMSPDGNALLSSIPETSLTVTDWYKQDVYDNQNNKIGAVSDVLVGQDGRVNALIIGVGGFLGAGEKDVAVSFNSVEESMKDNKNYLTMDTTKDALKSAPGYKYDSNKTTWVPDTSK